MESDPPELDMLFWRLLALDCPKAPLFVERLRNLIQKNVP